MKRYFIIALFSPLFFIKCSIVNMEVNKQPIKESAFIEFYNDDSIGIKADGIRFSDKKFNLKIPNRLKEQHKVVSYYFLNELIFNNDQRIISIYYPNEKFNESFKSGSYSSSQIEIRLEEIDLYSMVKHIELLPNRKFTVIRVDDDFILMYLNVKDKNVNDFNESLQSLKIE